MPIYEYTCEACEHTFDHLQRMDDPPPPCPECKGEKVKRNMSKGTSFQLKGGGWAEDGYSG